MLVGSYYSVMNKSDTVKIPKKLKESLGNNVILCIDLSVNCIVIIPLSFWDEFKKKLKDSTLTERFKIISDETLSSAKICSVDAMGQLTIDKDLLKLAGIKENCVFLGMQNYIELWDREKFDAYFANINMQEIESGLKKLGF